MSDDGKTDDKQSSAGGEVTTPEESSTTGNRDGSGQTQTTTTSGGQQTGQQATDPGQSSQATEGKDGQTSETGDTTETEELTWESWHDDAPEHVRSLVDQHIAGLQSALQSERAERKSVQADLKKLQKDLEDGKQVSEQQINDLQDRLSLSNERSEFYEDAQTAGIGDFRLAWLAYQEGKDTFTDRHGAIDWERFKEKHPTLFARPVFRPAPAGAGAGQTLDRTTPPPQITMDDRIRAAAGKRTSKSS